MISFFAEIKVASVSKDFGELALELFHALYYGQQQDLKFAISRVKIIAPRLHVPIQDEARRHEVTSLSVTMEGVIVTTQ